MRPRCWALGNVSVGLTSCWRSSFYSMRVPTHLEAPDGGWGILVCFGMAMPFVSGLASLPSFGLLFGDFLTTIGAQTSAVAFITSAFFCAFSFAGLFSGSLFNRFGLRLTGLMGGGLYFVGSIAQIFVRSTNDLVFAYSILQGVGFGLIVPTSYTSFNNYFVKKRVLFMSFAQTLIGVGTMFYPVAIEKLRQWYGFRGCLIVLAAINSHAILGMLLMQPVNWHMRRVEVPPQQMTVLKPPEIKIQRAISEVTEQPPTDGDHLSPLVAQKPTAPTTPVAAHNRKLSSRSSSITSLGNWSGPIVVSDASPEMTHVPPSRRSSAVSSVGTPKDPLYRTKWQRLVDFLDLTLLKEPIYVNIVLGISLALYSDIAFFTLQPIYMFELGFDKPNTADIIAIGAAADLASRIFLGCSAIFIQVPSRYIYLAGSFFTVIARFAFLKVTDYMGMALITSVLGFLRTWIHVPLPLVFAEYLPKDRFASGYGLFMFLQGNITFIIGPLVGYLRDRTQDYILTFHCINFFMALCAIPWIIEILFVNFRRRSKLGGQVENYSPESSTSVP